MSSVFPSVVTTWIRLPELGRFFSVIQSWKVLEQTRKALHFKTKIWHTFVVTGTAWEGGAAEKGRYRVPHLAPGP